MSHLLLTSAQRRQMLANGRLAADGRDIDPVPVVKLFLPDGHGTWLLTELDPDEPMRAYGLCDAGLGCPELGFVDLLELATLRGYLKLPVSRDVLFKPDKRLSVYAAEAIAAGRIIA